MNQDIAHFTIANNYFVGVPGEPWTLAGKQDRLKEAGNVLVNNLTMARLQNPLNGDAELLAGSPAMGKGVPLGDMKVAEDFFGRVSQGRNSIDAGAWAHRQVATNFDTNSQRRKHSKGKQQKPSPKQASAGNVNQWREPLKEAIIRPWQRANNPPALRLAAASFA